MLKNKIYGEEVFVIRAKYVYRLLIRIKKYLDKEVLRIEKKRLSLVKQEQQVQLTWLISILGIGIKTALFMILVTDKFENTKQLCSNVGITPKIRESGNSVRGRSGISKVGYKKLRNLYFCILLKFVKGCKEIYERIVNKGKSKKLALIAISNKRIKQSFAIAKSGKL
jgi:transposase